MSAKYWFFTGAATLSTAGNTFLYIAVPWALLAASGSATLAILSVAAQTAPYLVAPFIGPLIDRYDSRSVFFVGEAVQGVAVAAIPVTIASGALHLVLVELAVIGLANVVSDIAGDYGVLPTLVEEEQLERATALLTSSTMVARIAGPALAGLTIAGLGVDVALYIDAATFAVSAAVALLMPRQARGVEEAQVGFAEMLRDGLGFFTRHRGLWTMTLALAVYNLGGGALEATILTVGHDNWGWSAPVIGVLISVGSVGAALGAWGAGWVGRSWTHPRRITAWMLFTGVGTVLLLVPWPAVAALGFVLLNAGEGGVNVTTMTYRMRTIPTELTGRVNAVIRTFVTGVVPVSALLLGFTVTLGSANALVFLPVALGGVASLLLSLANKDVPSRGGLARREVEAA